MILSMEDTQWDCAFLLQASKQASNFFLPFIVFENEGGRWALQIRWFVSFLQRRSGAASVFLLEPFCLPLPDFDEQHHFCTEAHNFKGSSVWLWCEMSHLLFVSFFLSVLFVFAPTLLLCYRRCPCQTWLHLAQDKEKCNHHVCVLNVCVFTMTIRFTTVLWRMWFDLPNILSKAFVLVVLIVLPVCLSARFFPMDVFRFLPLFCVLRFSSSLCWGRTSGAVFREDVLHQCTMRNPFFFVPYNWLWCCFPFFLLYVHFLHERCILFFFIRPDF